VFFREDLVEQGEQSGDQGDDAGDDRQSGKHDQHPGDGNADPIGGDDVVESNIDTVHDFP